MLFLFCKRWVPYSDTGVSVVVLCCDQLAISDPKPVCDGDSVMVSSEEDRSDVWHSWCEVCLLYWSSAVVAEEVIVHKLINILRHYYMTHTIRFCRMTQFTALALLHFFFAAAPFSSSIRWRVIVGNHLIFAIASNCMKNGNLIYVHSINFLQDREGFTFFQCFDPFILPIFWFSTKVYHLFVIAKLYIVDRVMIFPKQFLRMILTWNQCFTFLKLQSSFSTILILLTGKLPFGALFSTCVVAYIISFILRNSNAK